MVWPGLRSTSRRGSDLYLNYLNPPQTSILLRGLVQGEKPRKVFHECVLQSVELIQGRQMAECQKCFFTCFQSTFSYCMYNMKGGLISEIHIWNMYYIDATVFFSWNSFYDYANTNGKFQHISECWIADQELIKSTFSLLVCFLYF